MRLTHALSLPKKRSLKKPFVCLRPKNLFVGIGCKRGTSEELVQSAFTAALAQAGAYPYQVASLASVDVKADEKGLLDFYQFHASSDPFLQGRGA